MSLFFLDQKGPVAKIDCLAVNIGSPTTSQSNAGGKTDLLVPMSAVAEIILKTMQGLDLHYPVVSDDEKSRFDDYRAKLNDEDLSND